METRNAHFARGRVLAVDDEPVARQQLAFQIAALGHVVNTASSADEAQEILAQNGPAVFDCLITDCWMPGRTGLDLLLWLQNHDETLASIVVSKAADKQLLTRTLRGGATDFIEKPVFKEELEDALQRTIQSTRGRRRNAATSLALREAGIVQRRMNNPRAALDLPASMTICYHPCHEAGGDSISYFSLDPSRMLIVVGDVSGHDLKSAFISAYFQGMLRGMISQNMPIQNVLATFNGFLLNEWRLARDSGNDCVPDNVSLSVCAASIDLQAGSVSLLNGGSPLANRIDRHGHPSPCGEPGGYPLGWFDPNPIGEVSFAVDSSDRLVIWTDGLEEFANQLQIGEWSLAFRILAAKEEGRSPAWLAEAPDDVLIVMLGLSKSRREPQFFPLLAECYGKGRIEGIDELQGEWRRSLAFALPDVSEDKLAEIILCTREAVLNALAHGCVNDSDQCRLTMVLDRAQNELRIDVSDPGPGHRFQPSASEDLMDVHLGLLLIHGLPDRVEQDADGADLRMFFLLDNDPAR